MIHKNTYLFAVFLLTAPLMLSGCKVELANTRPAREFNTVVPSQGDLYAGWRVFNDKCSQCHGIAATGSEHAPDLLLVLRDMNPRQFAALVLKRYDLDSGVARRPQDPSTLEKTIDQIMRRSEEPIEMPLWHSEPAVNAHILDLYAYLAARSEGRLGVECPPHK